MKKTIISLLLMAAPVAMFAQLKVKSNGTVSVGNNNTFPNSLFSVGNVSSSSSLGNVGIYSRIYASTMTSGLENTGVLGYIFAAQNCNKHTKGVYGHVMSGTSGKCFGVFGSVSSSYIGVGVYGTAGSYGSGSNLTVNGNYAGYFEGPVYTNGTLTTPQIITPSDISQTEDIISIAEEKRTLGSTLDNVMSMNVIKYKYKAPKHEKEELSEEEEDLLANDPEALKTKEQNEQKRLEFENQKHYGLSAQELQKIYPDLVRQGQDGNLGINYVELVPVLIRSIQELKQELDEVKGVNSEAKLSRSLVTPSASLEVSGNVLYQNTPNPFKEQTTIRFSLADDARDAAICIFDMTGKMLKKLPVSSGEASIRVNGWELGEGMFLYTLMVNGREIDTKRMIISK